MDIPEEKKDNFLDEMILARILYNEDENKDNDYILFLYVASIMNFFESHNNGCLTELGMKSLKININPILNKIIEKNLLNKVSQEELVKLCLHFINSYIVSMLFISMIDFEELSRDNRKVYEKDLKHFFDKFDNLPITVKNDLKGLYEKLIDLIDKVKSFLNIFTPFLDKEHKKIFTQEKSKGFIKQIFNPHALKDSLGDNVENAIEIK